MFYVVHFLALIPAAEKLYVQRKKSSQVSRQRGCRLGAFERPGMDALVWVDGRYGGPGCSIILS